MSRVSEMIDLWMFTRHPDSISEVDRILGHMILGILPEQIEQAAEYAEEGVAGIHLIAIAPDEKEAILDRLGSTGNFELLVEEISPEDMRYIAHTRITAIHKDATDLAKALREMLVIAHQISRDSDRELPGF